MCCCSQLQREAANVVLSVRRKQVSLGPLTSCGREVLEVLESVLQLETFITTDAQEDARLDHINGCQPKDAADDPVESPHCFSVAKLER